MEGRALSRPWLGNADDTAVVPPVSALRTKGIAVRVNPGNCRGAADASFGLVLPLFFREGVSILLGPT